MLPWGWWRGWLCRGHDVFGLVMVVPVWFLTGDPLRSGCVRDGWGYCGAQGEHGAACEEALPLCLAPTVVMVRAQCAFGVPYPKLWAAAVGQQTRSLCMRGPCVGADTGTHPRVGLAQELVLWRLGSTLDTTHLHVCVLPGGR